MKITRPLSVAAVAVLLSIGVAPATEAAPAGHSSSEPCAKEARQVTQAETALAHVTAVFEHQQTKVERLQEALAAATTPEEEAKIQAKLDKALAKEQHAKKAKKAQQKRLAKAEQRLAACEAANPS